jgi:hypothetical protein
MSLLLKIHAHSDSDRLSLSEAAELLSNKEKEFLNVHRSILSHDR